MRRPLVALALALSLTVTGCFTTIGAVAGHSTKDPQYRAGKTLGGAMLGIVADAALLVLLASAAYSDYKFPD